MKLLKSVLLMFMIFIIVSSCGVQVIEKSAALKTSGVFQGDHFEFEGSGVTGIGNNLEAMSWVFNFTHNSTTITCETNQGSPGAVPTYTSSSPRECVDYPLGGTNSTPIITPNVLGQVKIDYTFTAVDTEGESYSDSGSVTGSNYFEIPSCPGISAIQLGSESTPATYDSSGFEGISSLYVDDFGNIYFAGMTLGNFAESNGDGVSGTSGFPSGLDVLVGKFNKNCELEFVTQLGSETVGALGGDAANLDYPSGITVDGQGNIFVAGITMSNLADLNAGGGDIFLAKFNRFGEAQFIKQIGTNYVFPSSVLANGGGDASQDEYVIDAEVDPSGDIIISGDTYGDLGETGSGNDGYIIKFSGANGDPIFIKQLGLITPIPGGSNTEPEAFNSFFLDTTGNIYVSGFTHGSPMEPNAGAADPVMGKFDNDGNLIFMRQMGATTATSPLVPGDLASSDFFNDITVDSSGNIVLVGVTDGDVGETNGGAGSMDLFIVKYDSSGSLLKVVQFGNTTIAPGGTNNAGDEDFSHIASAPGGGFVVTGVTSGNFADTLSGPVDAALLKVDNDLNPIFAKQFGVSSTVPGGDTSGEESMDGGFLDRSGNIYLGGNTTGSFGETVNGPGDLLILKLDSSGNLP